MADRVDCLVLGGGPAGSSFARYLAQSGGRIWLVERHDFKAPRPGEHLAGGVRAELDRLGIAYPIDAGLVQSSPGIISIWDGPPLTRPYASSREKPALSVIRNRFDQWLFDAAVEAGAETSLRTRLIAASRTGGRWEVLLESAGGRRAVSAGCIVDATGRQASFARQQGAHRIGHGDLFALVGWLKPTGYARGHSLLTVEACASGWWSLSIDIGGQAIATHYTSLAALKASGLTPSEFWNACLGEAPAIRRAVGGPEVEADRVGVFPAFPGHSSVLWGDGWIAIGEAAAALDPIGGQGVLFALETAARASEALRADPSLTTLGPIYQQSVLERLQRHLAGRASLYESAVGILPEITERILDARIRAA